jgi:probable rRNA maturation factor
MSIIAEVQYGVPEVGIPGRADFQRWVAAALVNHYDHAELTIRVTDESEIAELNQRYRSKKGATNVLSFPFEAPPVPFEIPFLGDIVICAPVVVREARVQAKDAEAHWAHLVVHVVLHLLGFDHQEENEAQRMEALEGTILKSLGYSDPYASE